MTKQLRVSFDIHKHRNKGVKHESSNDNDKLTSNYIIPIVFDCLSGKSSTNNKMGNNLGSTISIGRFKSNGI